MTARRVPFALAILAAVFAVGGAAVAEPQPSDRASSGDFSVLALITDDPDWLQKWQTPSDVAPEFHTASLLHIGENGRVLVFFTGATVTDGKVRLDCEIAVTEGNGKTTSFPTQSCFDAPLGGPTEAVRLIGLDIGYLPVATDPSGLVTFDIAVTDLNANAKLSVSVSVEVQTGVTGT